MPPFNFCLFQLQCHPQICTQGGGFLYFLENKHIKAYLFLSFLFLKIQKDFLLLFYANVSIVSHTLTLPLIHSFNGSVFCKNVTIAFLL
jgi:hypothetical protein